MAEVSFTQTLTVVDCAQCGVQFAITKDYEQRRRRDHESFYCPAGHSNAYQTLSDVEKAQRETREAQAKINSEQHLRLVAEKERDKALAAKRKIERRISRGVCMCCNRTFPNLRQHMATKHKDKLMGGTPQKQLESSKPN